MKRHRTGDDDGQNYKHKEDDRENATEVQDFHLEYDNEYGEYDTGGGADDYLHPENQEDEYYDFDGYDGFWLKFSEEKVAFAICLIPEDC